VSSPHRPAGIIAVALTAAWFAACGSNPAGPSQPTGQSRAVSMTITGLSGAGAVTPGQPVPLTARVTLTDGTQKIASDATWQSADPTIVAVSSSGVVKAAGRGATDITASAAGATASIRVNVATPSVRLTQTIDRHTSTAALSGITNVTFDLNESSGGGLEYRISFGDGTADATEVVAHHVYSSPGTYTVVGRVTDAVGQVDTTSRTMMVTSIPAINYPYGWQNNTINPSIGRPELRSLFFTSQIGGKVIGTYQSSTGAQLGARPFAGTVTENDDLELSLTDSTIQMVGYIQASVGFSGASAIQVTMHGGSADGMLLVFKPYEPF
jgi:PKD repeat protein